MSRPEKFILASLEEAVAELKRDPSHPVQARVDGLDVEMRVLPSNETAIEEGATLITNDGALLAGDIEGLVAENWI